MFTGAYEPIYIWQEQKELSMTTTPCVATSRTYIIPRESSFEPAIVSDPRAPNVDLEKSIHRYSLF